LHCPNCRNQVVADRFFCTWCESLIPNPSVGKKAGLFRRWVASAIDPFLVFLIYALGVGATSGLGDWAVLLVSLAFVVFYFWLLSKGTTPGKMLLRERVVEKLTGQHPGFWRMILRELIGKAVSGLFLGLGFLWAIWDKDNQAWHDKIAGTVVIREFGGAGRTQIA
jgi:uncharacterized RDD family membrane protein YckC